MRAALAWVMVLAGVVGGLGVAGVAEAVPRRIMTDAAPRFEATIPDGYAPMRDVGGGEVLAGFAREGAPRDRAVMVLLVYAGAPIEQRALDEGVRARLRRADPFPFRDRVERFRALGFDVEGLRGEAVVNGHTVVRLAAPVPIEEAALAVVVVAPAESERDAQAVMTHVLGSMRARSNWMHPGQRALAWAAGVGAVVAVPVSLLYALLAAVLFRRRDRWRVARGVALVAAGAAWVALAAWVIARPAFMVRGGGVLLAVFGVVLAAHGAGMVRGARRQGSEAGPAGDANGG